MYLKQNATKNLLKIKNYIKKVYLKIKKSPQAGGFFCFTVLGQLF